MYIFLMDKGQLVQLAPTPPSVSSLQTMLNKQFELKIEKQILLVSGGFQLGPKDRLPINGAGLDKTNPIYVFTRASDEDGCVKQPDIFQVFDGGYPSELEQSLNLPSTFDNLTKGSSLVERIAPIAKETRDAVEQLMSEQGQMIQGWYVALANLAELAADAEKRLCAARKGLAQFENSHSEWQQKFLQVSDLKRDLSQVPLLPQLSQQFRGVGDEREGIDSHDSNSVPSNLYEWVCLQCTLSSGSRPSRRGSIANTAASRLQIAALFLGRPDLLPGAGSGRSRTTSADHVEINEIPIPLHGADGHRRSPACGLTSVPSARNLFYATGSQPSLNSLLAYCATEGTSPSGLLGAAGQPSETITTPGPTSVPDAGWDSYEVGFLSIIRKAQEQLNFLRFGSKSVPENCTEFDSDMTYVQLQLIRLSELLSLVSTCSNSPTRISPNGDSSSSDTAEGKPCTGSTAQLQHVSADLIIRSREALNPSLFSQRLAHVSTLADMANQMVDQIHQVMRTLTELCKYGPHGRDISDYTTHLRTVLFAFRQLCNLLDETMDSKLQLAHTLRERQHWLQHFQSELHRLDSSIQNCVLQSKRVTTTATLVAQLQKAPEVYVRCLVEVARQHDFEHCFMQVSREQQALRMDEVQRRRTFAKQIRENILHSLFSPWTGTKGDRCGLTRAGSVYGRGLHSPDLDTAVDAGESAGRPAGTGACQLSRQSSRNSNKENAYARSSINSRSEPQLNELTKTAGTARLSFRSRQKDGTFMTASPVLHEVHEDETEPRVTEFPAQPRNFSSTNLLMDQRLRVRHRPSQTNKVESVLRRASVPVEFEGEFPPSHPRWTIEDTDGASTETDTNPGSDAMLHSTCITTDDLTRLAQVLPHNLGDYLREELIRTSLRRPVIPSGWFDACRPTAEHVGLCPQGVFGDRSRNPSQTLPKCSGSATVDVACQVEMSLLVSGPVAQWPLRSHSASLFLPLHDSPPRPTTIAWEPTPSSACSWDLCHVPANRSVKHSVSMNAIDKIQTVKTRATQTGGDSDAGSTSGLRSDALSLVSSSSATSEALFSSQAAATVTKPDASTIQIPPSDSTTCLINRNLDTDSVPARLHSMLDLDEVPGITTAAATTTTTMTEHSNGGDAEFATPSTMMSSFHSTRTNLSANADGDTSIWLPTQSNDEDNPDEQYQNKEESGATPTVDQSQRLVHRRQHRRRHVESPTQCGDVAQIGDCWSPSDESSPEQPSCSCHLRRLHARCVTSLEQFADALSSAQPAGPSGGSDKRDSNEPRPDPTQAQRLNQLMRLLFSYTEDYPLSPCELHPTRRVNSIATGHGLSAIPNQQQQPLTIAPDDTQISLNEEQQPARNDYATEPVTPQTSTIHVQTDDADRISRATSISPPPSSPDLLDGSLGPRDRETDEPVRLQSPVPSKADVSASGRATPIDQSIARAKSPLPSAVRFLPNPLSLGSITVLERFLTFVHRNFSTNDTVVFIPVRGSAAHTSKSCYRVRVSAEDQEGEDPRQLTASSYHHPPPGFLRAISPTSSMLSSTIIQSIDPQGAEATASSRHRDLMYASLDPVVTPATSALVSDLLGHGTDPRSDRLQRLSTTRTGSSSSMTCAAAVTQWRMLSSDGHVYFLHQDDFAPLNLDIHTDYCQPSISAPHGSHPSHNNRNVPAASVTNLPRSGVFGPVSSRDQDTAHPSGRAVNSELQSYFVVASYQRKERCLSKRVDNRFNLPVNFAFYRVRAKPLAVTSDVTALLADP